MAVLDVAVDGFLVTRGSAWSRRILAPQAVSTLWGWPLTLLERRAHTAARYNARRTRGPAMRNGLAKSWSALALSLLLCGCDRGQAPIASAAPDAPAVDPRYSSADALLDQYNRLITTGERVDAGAVLDLIHCENDLQRRIMKLARSMMPMIQLDQAMWERFSAGLDPKSKRPPLAPMPGPARMTQREEQRAQALEPQPDGSDEIVYLIKSDGRWWVSGYSLEYNIEYASMVERAPPDAESAADELGAVFAELHRRLDAGEFKDAESVRLALLEVSAKRAAEEAAKAKKEQEKRSRGVSTSPSGG
jgi:hypothetical protein